MGTKEIETIMEIAHKNQTAERVFTFLALKMRHRRVLNLNKTKKHMLDLKEIINDTDFSEVFNSLAKHGYGRFKNSKEFEFNHPMYQIGRAALEGKSFSDVNKPLDRPINNPTYDVKHLEDSKKYKVDGGTVGMTPRPMPISLVSRSNTDKTVVYFMKNGRSVKVTLEGNISSDELENIIASLESKPVSA